MSRSPGKTALQPVVATMKPETGLILAALFATHTPQEVADAIRAQRELGFAGGMLITNPVPADHAMDTYKIEHVIQHALSEAKRKNVTGKALTPFLLDRIKQLTGGESLETNISLVENNVRLAAKIAACL